MKKTFKDLFPLFIAITFWIIYFGIGYLIFKDKVILIALVTLLLVSILSLLIVVIGYKIVDIIIRVNNLSKNNTLEQFDASTQIKMWSLEHPPWM